MNGEREHLERVRDRFTRTAQQFAQFALTTRSEEAERLARLATADFPEAAGSRALDLACGPGTFARALASRVRFVLGLDLTPAMLKEAVQTAVRARLPNLGFACADANSLPLPDASLDVAVCSYSFHHFLDPVAPVREMARVVRHGGRVAAVDLIMPEGADAEAHNQIELARDSSHARILGMAEVHALFETARLRVLTSETGERLRRFDEWMVTVGSPRGSPAYAETRRLMEASLAGDTAGFHPRYAPGST